MDVENVLNPINRQNQAINPKFLGPLFIKGVMGLFNVSSLGLDLVPLLIKVKRGEIFRPSVVWLVFSLVS